MAWSTDELGTLADLIDELRFLRSQDAGTSSCPYGGCFGRILFGICLRCRRRV